MTQPLRIGIDIDGVLASGFHEEAARILGKPKGWLPKAWNYGLKREELGQLLDRIFDKEDLWFNSPSHHKNCEVLANFLANHQDDVEVFYITARRPCAGQMGLRKQTLFWLVEHDLYRANCTLLLTGEERSKRQVIHALGIEFFLDDHLKQVRDIASVLGRTKSYLLDAPYNRPRWEGTPVVYSVSEYLGEVEKWLASTKQSPQS